MSKITWMRQLRRITAALCAISGGALAPAFGQSDPSLRGDKLFIDGNSTVGSGYHVVSGRVTRTVQDLSVTGSVGKYPLTLTRIMRNWVTPNHTNTGIPNWNEEAGCSAKWWFNIWGYAVRIVDTGYTTDQGVYLTYPDGSEDRVIATPQAGIYTFGAGDRVYLNSSKQPTILKLQDGGTVYFVNQNSSSQRYWPTDRVLDPNGMAYIHTVSTLANGSIERRVTDPAGQWVRVIYGTGTYGSVYPVRGETSTGEYVDYIWDFSASGITIPNVDPSKLTEARYADGTTATYQYTQNSNGVFPYRCYDTRALSKLQQVEYQFNLTKKWWGDVFRKQYAAIFPLISERLPGAALALSTRTEISAGAAGGFGATETRGDGASRTFIPRSAFNISGPTAGRLYSATNFRGQTTNLTPTSVTDPLGRTTTFTYPNSGSPSGSTNQISWIENPTQVVQPDGTTKSLSFTDINNPYFVASFTDELGRVTTYDRFPNGLVGQINYPNGSNEGWNGYNAFNQATVHRLRNGTNETFVFDSIGRLTTHNLPAGGSISYTYYPDGHVWENRVATITDPRGNVTTYEYDLNFVGGVQSGTAVPGRGNVTKITNADGTYKSFAYDKYGRKIWEENEMRQRTSITYDDYGRKLSVTDPSGAVTTFQYQHSGFSENALAHAENMPRAIILPSGKRSGMLYDADFNLTSEILAETTGDAVTVTHQYDAVGNRTQTTDGAGRITSFVYDSRNRLITRYAPGGRTTDFGYDSVGNNTWTRNPDGTMTYQSFTSMNQLNSATDEMGRVTNYIYYASGKVQWVIDANNNSYSFWYDSADRQTHMWFTNAAQNGFDLEQTSYDNAGNITGFRNRSGSWKTLTYDNRNRETASSWNDGVTPSTSTQYDAVGRVTQKSSTVSTVTFTYDATGRLTSETQSVAGTTAAAVGYSYDADGNRSSISAPGYYLAYVYNNRQQLTNIKYGGGADVATLTYSSEGRRRFKNLINNTSIEYNYDTVGRLNYLKTYQTSSSATFLLEQYGFDLRDRRTWSQRNSSLGDTFAYQADGELIDFKFNANNPTGTPTTWASKNAYVYDNVGNRTSVVTDGITTTYTPNHANQYSSISGMAIQHSDGRGNTTVLGDASCTYDAENHLLSISRPGVSATFSYDPTGRLVKKVINGQTEYLVYDGINTIVRTNGSGGLIQLAVYGPRSNELVSDYTPSRGYFYYHLDYLGSIATATNGSGAVIERYLYDAFGAVKVFDGNWAPRASSANGTRNLFGGHEYIAEIGLYNMKNRFYSPTIGRFLQADPTGLTAGDINLYRYVNNNPGSLIDPLGLEKEVPDGANGADNVATPTQQPETKAPVTIKIFGRKVKDIAALGKQHTSVLVSQGNKSTVAGAKPSVKVGFWAEFRGKFGVPTGAKIVPQTLRSKEQSSDFAAFEGELKKSATGPYQSPEFKVNQDYDSVIEKINQYNAAVGEAKIDYDSVNQNSNSYAFSLAGYLVGETITPTSKAPGSETPLNVVVSKPEVR